MAAAQKWRSTASASAMLPVRKLAPGQGHRRAPISAGFSPMLIDAKAAQPWASLQQQSNAFAGCRSGDGAGRCVFQSARRL